MAMRIDKERKAVNIYTGKYKISGNIHIVSKSRLTDAMEGISKQSEFLPVTDAVIVFPEGTRKEVNFLLVKISDIELLCLADSE